MEKEKANKETNHLNGTIDSVENNLDDNLYTQKLKFEEEKRNLLLEKTD